MTKKTQPAGDVPEDIESESEDSGVLNLIDKPKRRKRKGPLDIVEEPKVDKPSVIEQKKEDALDLLEDKPKRVIRRNPDVSIAELNPLDAMLRRVNAPEVVAPTPEVAPEPEVVDLAPMEEETPVADNVIQIKPPILVRDLAEKLGVKTFKIIQDLIAFEVFAKPDKAIEPDIAAAICEKHGFIFERERREKGAGVHQEEKIVVEPAPVAVIEEPKDLLEFRPPIITVMGHVDHGKTSLLDAVRKSKVVSGEAGGITQHIQAYSVKHNGATVTFIDTPGHAAFSEMRARGANVTDMVVLVVAADDGFMPQTIEALNHAKAAKVPIIVAINKIDLPAANALKVRTQMQEQGIPPVEWGGETEVVEISALKGTGIDALLELLALQSEVLELKANPHAPARAVVIESRQEPGRGPTASVIVTQGALKVGKAFICGPFHGKVKSLIGETGEKFSEIRPGMPAELVGFSDAPNVGDEVVEMASERDAKKLSEERQAELRREKLSTPRRSQLDKLFADIEDGGRKSLRLVVKTDVQGSSEAISSALRDIKSDKVDLEILHTASGAVTESDVLLSSASDAIVIGFNTRVDPKAITAAKREGIQIKLYSIIYELIDQVKEAMLGLLDPLTREAVTGHAKVKAVFKVNRGKVAGCLITDGKAERKARARLLRDGQPVYDGGVETLRRFNDNVGEVRSGIECGVRLGDFNDYVEGDVIEFYMLEKVSQTL